MAEIKKEKLIKLVTEAQQENNEAFGELFQIYYDELIRIAIKHTGGKFDIAEDLVQDSMVKAMRNIHTLENPLAFPGWIDRIVINRCKDYVTSFAVKNNSTFSGMSKNAEDDDIEFDPEDKKITSDPAEKLSQDTRDKMVQDIITNLPDDQRIATILFYYDEMSIKEVAEALSLKESTVIGRLQTAKKAIKSEVTAIQKKYDLKLYGIAPWPFFLYLLGKAKEEIKPFPVVDVSTKETNKKANNNTNNTEESNKSEHTNKANSKASDMRSNQRDNSVSNVEKKPRTCSKQVVGSSEIVSSPVGTIGAATAAKSVAGLNGVVKLIAVIGVAVGVSAGGYAIYNVNNNNSSPVTMSESSISDRDAENTIDTTISGSSLEENDTLKQVEAIPNKLEISIPESWYIEQNINQNSYITKVHLSDNSYIQIRSDRPDGGAGGSYSVESASEKSYGNLTFWETDSSDDEGHTGAMIFHSNSNSYGDDGSLKDGDWYDYIIQTYDVDMNDATVQQAISSIKVKMDCKVKVIVDQLNVRNDFSTTSPIYSTAKQGDTFDVYRTVLTSEPHATWYQILVDGQWKWLCGGETDGYVEKIGTDFE